MTEDEKRLKLEAAQQAVQIMIDTFFPEITMLLIVNLEDTSGVIYNGCALCSIEDAVQWAEDNNIQHLARKENTSNKVH